MNDMLHILVALHMCRDKLLVSLKLGVPQYQCGHNGKVFLSLLRVLSSPLPISMLGLINTS
jgi:hypothetical protein